MRVSHQDQIDAGNLTRDRERGVFIRYLRRIGHAGAQVFFDTHVHGDDDDVCFLFVTHHRHPLLCFAHRFAKFQARIILRVLPVGNAWSSQAQNADAHTLNLHDQVRFVMRRRGG